MYLSMTDPSFGGQKRWGTVFKKVLFEMANAEHLDESRQHLVDISCR